MVYNGDEMHELFLGILGLLNTVNICRTCRSKIYSLYLSQCDDYEIIERYVDGLDHSTNNLLEFIRTFPQQERYK